MSTEVYLNGVPCPSESNGGNLFSKMDEACLVVQNADSVHTIELFGQSKECYKCSFWHYATLWPKSNATLIVNTTYPTMLSTENLHSHLYGFEVHFKEAASYLLTLNSSGYDIVQTRPSDGPYYSLLYALLFYATLLAVWTFASFLYSSMDSSANTSETTPILPPANEAVPEDDSLPSTSRDEPQRYPTYQSTESNTPSAVQASSRRVDRADKLRSLDVFRGFTIFLMIFVNYGGGKFFFFKHSPWNGLTVADLVFPWFVWIMGVSMMFSLRSQFRKGVSKYSIVCKIVIRSVILCSLGLFINGLKNSDLKTLRIPGVLQRLGGCYFVVGIMETLLFVDPEGLSEETWGGWYMFRDMVHPWLQWSVVIGLASIQCILTYVLPVSGCPRGYLGPGGLHDYSTHTNCTGGAAAYIDRLIFTSAHLYKGSSARNVYQNTAPHDPEGLLGYLTSMLLLEFGVAAGRVLLTYEDHKSRIVRLLAWGFTAGVVGAVLCGFRKEDGIVPVNKNLWSLSYVLVTACFAFVLFSALYAIIDGCKKWSGDPFSFAGYNSILLYVGHEITKGVFPFGWTPLGPYHGTYLLVSLWGASLWMFIAYLCHRKSFYVTI